MAFPVVATTNTSENATATTSHTVSLPASLAAGDLLIVFFVNEDDTTVTTPSGWSVLKSMLETGGATSKTTIFYKTSDGGEGSSLAITTSSSRVSTHAAYRITGWSGTPEVSTGATSTTGEANPDSLTPAGGAKDYLWIVVAGKRNTTSVSGYPTNYTGSQLFIADDGALGGSSITVATRGLNSAGPEDPGSFAHSDTGFWTACTIAVSPAAGGSTSKYQRRMRMGIN